MHELRKLKNYLETESRKEKIADIKLSLTKLTSAPWFIESNLDYSKLENLILQSAQLEWGNETTVEFDRQNKSIVVKLDNRKTKLTKSTIGIF